MNAFPSLRVEGGLFSPDLFENLLHDQLLGQKAQDFGLPKQRDLTNEIAAVYHDARALWQIFQRRLERLPADDLATSETRDSWVIPFLRLLGYDLHYQPRALERDGLTFAISHALVPAPNPEQPTPVHIVGYRQELGRLAPSGRPRLSPHALVQEYLNRSEALWGLVTNGRTLRLLRDSTFVRRQAYVEFDLEGMFEEERFADFVLLYRLLHRTRLPGDGRAEDCLLEQYYQRSIKQGGKVRERLREGVEECLTILANGFLGHEGSSNLREWVKREAALALYKQLLRLVYRFLFLLVSEERGLMGQNPLYLESYGIARLRRLCENRAAYTDDPDLWLGLRALWETFRAENLAAILGVPPLNGELFAPQELDNALITNRDLLSAFWHLAFYDSPPRRVNYAALDTEELGSVYESLLDYHPAVTFDSTGRPHFELAPGSERKSTGSYYTPPQLVSELIRSALEPVIAERLRARQHESIKDEEHASVRGSRSQPPLSHSQALEQALLSIKVCDPACGSGHFLLAAARRLGKELARIRSGEDEPAPEQVRAAIRDVVTHCIYGVDKNPLAVELARVALWLESHAEGKPLTFLDHRIRCGDSLVGVFDLNVLKNGIPDEAFNPLQGDDRKLAAGLKRQNKAEREGQMTLFGWHFDLDLKSLAQLGQELDSIPDDSPEQVRRKRQRYESRWNDPALRRQKQACDLWTAAFFQRFSPAPPLFSSPALITTDTVRRALAGQPVPPQTLAQAEALAAEARFFHWPLAFPEVFAQGGYDVVIGNPPFMGGLKISGHFGLRYRRWLEVIYDPFAGTADLCAAFYRRAYSLLRAGGHLGMVATNTIGQGDTRESGLLPIVRQGGTITFARRFIQWPGAANVEVNLVGIHTRHHQKARRQQKRAANVEVNLVGIHKPGHSQLGPRSSPVLDGQPVPFICSRLNAEPEGDPRRLPQNEGKAFQGDIVRGIGFVLEPAEAEALLTKDPRNADCLFLYLNGEDLNSHPEQQPSRWVICFHDWSLERARQYPNLLKIVEERVKPERDRLTGPGDKRNREFWWQFGAYRAGMRQAIAPLRRVLVRAEVGQMHSVSFVPKEWIYSHMLIVFAFDDDYHFALLQSAVHETWLRKQASSLRTDIRYTPTDCFDTFPFPPAEYAAPNLQELLAQPAFARAAQLGAEYHEHRRQVMLARGLGLTKTYNLFHEPACRDADIVRLRELHAEMDNAVLACYGWEDLALKHDFYQNDRGQTRFMPSAEARRELIFRLMALNEKMAEEEK